MNGDRPTLRWFDVMVLNERERTVWTAVENLDSAAEAFTYGRAYARANPADRVLVAETARTFYLVVTDQARGADA